MSLPLTPLDYPPPGTRYTPGSDADAVHEALAAAKAVKRWAGYIAILAAILAVMGFTDAGFPSRRIARLEARVDSLVAMREEILDVKFILCAQRQPTGDAAAQKCSRRSQ